MNTIKAQRETRRKHSQRDYNAANQKANNLKRGGKSAPKRYNQAN